MIGSSHSFCCRLLVLAFQIHFRSRLHRCYIKYLLVWKVKSIRWKTFRGVEFLPLFSLPYVLILSIMIIFVCFWFVLTFKKYKLYIIFIYIYRVGYIFILLGFLDNRSISYTFNLYYLVYVLYTLNFVSQGPSHSSEYRYSSFIVSAAWHSRVGEPLFIQIALY